MTLSYVEHRWGEVLKGKVLWSPLSSRPVRLPSGLFYKSFKIVIYNHNDSTIIRPVACTLKGLWSHIYYCKLRFSLERKLGWQFTILAKASLALDHSFIVLVLQSYCDYDRKLRSWSYNFYSTGNSMYYKI